MRGLVGSPVADWASTERRREAAACRRLSATDVNFPPTMAGTTAQSPQTSVRLPLAHLLYGCWCAHSVRSPRAGWA